MIPSAHIWRSRLIALAFGLIMATSAAFGASVQLTWTAPTTNTDGSAITGTLNYNIYRGTSATTLTKLGSSSTTSYTDASPVVGTNYYAVTAVNSAGTESAQSNVVSKTIAPPVPSAPTGLTVTSPTAYYIIQQSNKFVAVPVGTVPANTPCDTTQNVNIAGLNGMYVVDRATVTWTGNVHPLVVVAACGA